MEQKSRGIHEIVTESVDKETAAKVEIDWDHAHENSVIVTYEGMRVRFEKDKNGKVKDVEIFTQGGAPGVPEGKIYDALRYVAKKVMEMPEDEREARKRGERDEPFI